MKNRIVTIGVLVLATLATASAEAGPFRVRTSRPGYADTEVARPVTLQKEWAEFGLTYQFRDVTQYTDADGNAHDASYHYTMSWLTLDARYGFTKNLTMWMSIPFSVFSNLEGEPTDSSVTAFGMGDVRFGATWQVVAREAKSSMTSVAVQFDTKQPSGNESPGAPGDRALLLGTGTTNAGLKVIAKQRVGPVAVVANAGYTHKFSAVTMYLRDDQANGLNGRFKPGDELTAGAHVIVQPLRLVAADLGADYVNRSNASAGHSASGWNPGADLQTIPDSGFEALNVSAKGIVQLSQNWDVVGGASFPVMSKNSDYWFPMEDLSQSYGLTVTGALFFRW